MRKFYFILAALLLLYGCAGTGTKEYSSIARAIDDESGKKVFVYRDNVFVGSATLMQVRLNGIEIAKLGVEEMVIGNGEIGTNTLEVEIGGLGGLGLNTPSLTFELTDNQNSYFVLSLKQGWVSNKLQILETTKSAWQALAQE